MTIATEKAEKREPLLQRYIPPREVLQLNEFAGDHQQKVKHLSRAGRTLEMGCDDSPGKENYCSEATWPIQSGNKVSQQKHIRGDTITNVQQNTYLMEERDSTRRIVY